MTIKQQYMKERKRVLNYINRNTKKGFIFEDIPKIPKKITRASVNRLKKLTAKVLTKKSSFVNFETGEILSGARGKDILRSKSAKRAAETRKLKKIAEERFFTIDEDVVRSEYVADVYDVAHANISTLLDKLFSLGDETYWKDGVGRWRKGGVLSDLHIRNTNKMKDIYERNLSKYGDNYLRYLSDNIESINLLIDELIRESDSNKVEMNYGALAKILDTNLNVNENSDINEYYI